MTTDVQKVTAQRHRPAHLRPDATNPAPKRMRLRTRDDLMLYGVLLGVVRPSDRRKESTHDESGRSDNPNKQFDPVEFAEQMRVASRSGYGK